MALKPHLAFPGFSEDLQSSVYYILGKRVVEMPKNKRINVKGRGKKGNKMRSRRERVGKDSTWTGSFKQMNSSFGIKYCKIRSIYFIVLLSH